MNHMTVIFANMQDDDCASFPCIWEGIDNVRVVEVRKDSVGWKKLVDDAIAEEDDTLVFLGHGSPSGLYFPDFDRNDYIFSAENLHLVKARHIYCSWCYASSFCIDHNLHSFSTSMFISNVDEAMDNDIYSMSQKQINDNTERFDRDVNFLLRNCVPMDQWLMYLGARMDIENEVDVFNRQSLCYN